MIDRKELIESHNPQITSLEIESPLTVGNGEIAFTADITGMQTFYHDYNIVPLCTMSQWGWHTTSVNDEKAMYTLNDLVMTEYEWNKRIVRYPKEKMPGNEDVYDWLRKNPHRLNLFRLGFLWEEKELAPSMVETIHQELHLYEGILESRFSVLGNMCRVESACDKEGRDRLAFSIKSNALSDGRLCVGMDFPYGSPEISASDWCSPEKHITKCVFQDADTILLHRELDQDMYEIAIHANGIFHVDEKKHHVSIKAREECLYIVIEMKKKIEFPENIKGIDKEISVQSMALEVMDRSKNGWREFWEQGGVIRLNRSRDKRAWELERRIVLSQYLMAVNCTGSAPPQETGLICNSWYGKMHLEMYLWHCAWLPLWNHGERMEKSVKWYQAHLSNARENAARNGYRGARWPKMVALEGVDCPSPVAPLLVWQQPHIIYMLELAYRQFQDDTFLRRYWELVRETADFMTDYVVWNEKTGCYDICAPVIPVQECHRETETKNPSFEVEYWSFALHIAGQWAVRLKKPVPETWLDVAQHMAQMKEQDGYYLAHENCPNTFTEYNRDHPSMLGAFGLIDSGRVDKTIMKHTLEKILNCWEEVTLWGWDFAMMAMTAIRLGKPEMAVDILLKDSPKNRYLKNGNNMQMTRKDLPLYLPGNGSLLLVAAMMTAGYDGCQEKTPGFPKDGNWVVEYENIDPFPSIKETIQSL